MAISACSFRSSSSSSSSSAFAGALPLTDNYVSIVCVKISRFNSLSPFETAGNLCISSDTGTVPVFSILSSSCSCSNSASSSSNSLSSIVSPIGAFVMALAISSPSACCSRSLSLPGCQYIYPYIRDSHKYIHRLINLVDIEFPMYLLHGFASTLHRCKGFFIDIRRLDRVYLLF